MTKFDVLPSHVWPRSATRATNGEVTIAGVSLADLAQEFGTPLFVIDEADFRSRCQDMAAAFGGGENVHYASKAFLTRKVANWVAEEGLSLDVASENELRLALAADFPAERITVHGNNKSDGFLHLCVEAQVGHVVLDNHDEIARLDAVAAELGQSQDVLVRVKPGVEAHTHEMIATAHEDQKFGFSLASGSAFQAAEEAIAANNIRLVGLHCHVGSQVFDAQGFNMAAERVLGLMEQIVTSQPAEVANLLTILDLGGGYGIAYTANDESLDVAAVAADLHEKVTKSAESLGLATPTVMVEPGRAIAGPATVTVYEVGAIKDVHISDNETRRYLAVDGGMSDNIRPALYGAEYDIRLVNRTSDAKLTNTRVVGAHCESGDILINAADLPADIHSGDLVALAATGAYCYAMASNYNMFGKPAVVSVRDGVVSPMLRRQTVSDFLALEA
ncbi:diaminopimelate decarboxylase [Corynebacterium epidermidicanis]|uniref:Diaminopimelate decarboxylase n=1 Tax=Corynebacterium epidermidicanis TaxID=1050174 RepID=A0A0G3GVI1_9CORY|nr:diaminopimelate decarboxylase [Corynebacterium epidermidicanis]AKK02867.1 diaminopimelate decarboxylase [Corynebacterium epidermidicanis]